MTTTLISCVILKLAGWHDFLFSPFDNSWYAFPPHLNKYISLDVKVPGLLSVIKDQMWKS